MKLSDLQRHSEMANKAVLRDGTDTSTVKGMLELAEVRGVFDQIKLETDSKYANRSFYLKTIQLGVLLFPTLGLAFIPTGILLIWLGCAAAIAALGIVISLKACTQTWAVTKQDNLPLALTVGIACSIASALVGGWSLVTIALLIANAVMFRSLPHVKESLQDHDAGFTKFQIIRIVCFLPAIIICSLFSNTPDVSFFNKLASFITLSACIFILLKAVTFTKLYPYAIAHHKKMREAVANFLEHQTPPIPSTVRNISHAIASLSPEMQQVFCKRAGEYGFSPDLVLAASRYPIGYWIMTPAMFIMLPMYFMLFLNLMNTIKLREYVRIQNMREGFEIEEKPHAEHEGMSDVQKV